jgi:hypothetical protein
MPRRFSFYMHFLRSSPQTDGLKKQVESQRAQMAKEKAAHVAKADEFQV